MLRTLDRAWLEGGDSSWFGYERRLARFVPRASLVQRRLQDDWAEELAAPPQVIVSTSAMERPL